MMIDKQPIVKNGHRRPTSAGQHLAVAESMAFLHGRATIRLRRGFGRVLLTVDATEDGLTYSEQWRNGYRFDDGPVSREEALALLEGETG